MPPDHRQLSVVSSQWYKQLTTDVLAHPDSRPIPRNESHGMSLTVLQVVKRLRLKDF